MCLPICSLSKFNALNSVGKEGETLTWFLLAFGSIPPNPWMIISINGPTDQSCIKLDWPGGITSTSPPGIRSCLGAKLAFLVICQPNSDKPYWKPTRPNKLLVTTPDPCWLISSCLVCTPPHWLTHSFWIRLRTTIAFSGVANLVSIGKITDQKFFILCLPSASRAVAHICSCWFHHCWLKVSFRRSAFSL